MNVLPEKGETKPHEEFAREVYAELRHRAGDDKNAIIKEARELVKVLANTGHTAEVKKDLQHFLTEDVAELNADGKKTVKKIWQCILDGFRKEGNTKELQRTLDEGKQWGFEYDEMAQEILVTKYARADDVKSTIQCFEEPLPEGVAPTASTLLEILRFAIRNDELDWVNPIFKEVVATNPDKDTWDVVLLWAAEGLNKGVEEVERMMTVMEKYNPDDFTKRPDIDTINKLVESAILRKDPYLAERYISLATKRNLLLNAKTYAMQMDYRLDANDLSGAQSAYELLRGEDTTDRADLPVVNRYLRVLCSASKPNLDRIQSILTDLDERYAILEPQTLALVSLLYLRNNDITEVINTLQANVYHHDIPSRDLVRDAIFGYCLDHDNSTAQVWDAYNVLRAIYPETTKSMRTQLMTSFFERKRSDMACHVFGHMRAHEDRSVRPDAETYAACLVGIGACEDDESLAMVHNMMKMDSAIEPTTKVYNALMIAYTSIGDADKAFEFWKDITNSREGPSYESLEIVFWVCQGRMGGDKAARGIWSTMKRMEIEVTGRVYGSYCTALAGHGLTEEALEMLEGMERECGKGPDGRL
jgi:pentatricopeptide repeat protein